MKKLKNTSTLNASFFYNYMFYGKSTSVTVCAKMAVPWTLSGGSTVNRSSLVNHIHDSTIMTSAFVCFCQLLRSLVVRSMSLRSRSHTQIGDYQDHLPDSKRDAQRHQRCRLYWPFNLCFYRTSCQQIPLYQFAAEQSIQRRFRPLSLKKFIRSFTSTVICIPGVKLIKICTLWWKQWHQEQINQSCTRVQILRPDPTRYGALLIRPTMLHFSRPVNFEAI